MARINRDKIIDATLEGLNIAQKNYLEWTNNENGISWGAEYVLTTYVAESVFKVYKDYLFIERSIKQILKDAQFDKALEKSRPNGRADITLYSKTKNGEKPKAIIELKNNVNRLNKGIKEDIERIEALINSNVIEYGAIAFVTEVEKNKEFDIEKIKKEMKEIALKCKNYTDLHYKYKYKVSDPDKTEYNDTWWAWGSCVILFSKKRKRIL